MRNVEGITEELDIPRRSAVVSFVDGEKATKLWAGDEGGIEEETKRISNLLKAKKAAEAKEAK